MRIGSAGNTCVVMVRIHNTIIEWLKAYIYISIEKRQKISERQIF